MNAERGGAVPDLSRRALLVGTGVAGAVGVAAALVANAAGRVAGVDDASRLPVPAAGEHQAGVARPSVPQQHCLLVVADAELTSLQDALVELGRTIRAATAAPSGLVDLTPDGPGDLTVTVGLGPDALAATAHPELAALVELPVFEGDAGLPTDRRGGSLLLSVNASDPSVLEPVMSALTEAVPGFRIRWSEFGYRGTPVDGVTRNPFGYFDGIVVPRTVDELRSDVWIGDGPLGGGSICVIRRFRLDVERFRMLPQAERDAVMGREQESGAPLSGGDRDDQVDLAAKRPDGAPLIPAGAHARAAHPSFTGSALMLRRSYSYRASAEDHGHLFISFQNDPQTFIRTQLRLDERDELMAFSTPTATGAFAILPGMDGTRPLGATLF